MRCHSDLCQNTAIADQNWDHLMEQPNSVATWLPVAQTRSSGALKIALNKSPSSVWDEAKRSEGIGNPGDLSAGGVWFRSGSLLKHSAFKSGICGFSPSPWSRWKWCILSCREAPCSIVVMFLLWHISSSRLTKREKVNWPLRRGLRVHERGRFLPERTMLGKKKMYFLSDQSVNSKSELLIPTKKSKSKAVWLFIIQF